MAFTTELRQPGKHDNSAGSRRNCGVLGPDKIVTVRSMDLRFRPGCSRNRVGRNLSWIGVGLLRNNAFCMLSNYFHEHPALHKHNLRIYTGPPGDVPKLFNTNRVGKTFSLSTVGRRSSARSVIRAAVFRRHACGDFKQQPDTQWRFDLECTQSVAFASEVRTIAYGPKPESCCLIQWQSWLTDA